ncbi:keratin, type I cytoskeletal 9 [Acyrthosiphon pisum]|uniref:Outer dynein arm-docking complex subunit 4 n=2 Tax=Aphidinae TaxID=133076 RepID=A0A8R2ABC0_ACYPI|nr:keratin, type I cytoskeletal 9 [Acyrthosiphon pisum]|eukprot:XP_003244745.1 PREDICTED: keratin, type I cytoskeletal 9 [Acyrthosiphon pisum]
MAGLGDTSGDIQPRTDHAKDILQMTRDSEMMQSYVRVGKSDESDDCGGGGGGSEGNGVSVGGVGGGVGRGESDSDDVAGATGYVVGVGAGVGDGHGVSGAGRPGRKGCRVAGGRRHGRRRGGGGGGGGGGGAAAGGGGGGGGGSSFGGGGGGGATTTFDELTEEFKTRKSGTGGGGGVGGGVGGGGSGFGGGWAKRHKRDSRSRLLEEVYTDKDRAAAVNLGTRDIKASLRMKRRQDRNRTLHIPSTAESPTLLALARHCVNDVSVSLEFIDKALELSPNDKTALVSRSKCYLLLGQPRLALKDAEVALNEDSTYLKAIYQKAEALYHLGDFEHSLVFYHRGLHVRPELEQFRLGVQKAREAIENAIGKMKDTAVVMQQVGWGDKRQATTTGTVNGGGGGVGGSRGSTPAVTGSTTRRKDAVASAATTKSQSKMLLRELCVDKDYLEHLTIDPNIVSAIQENDNYILSEAKDGINFLNGREEFWKQQKLIN